ncbi:24341_t:CDS:2 [Entrophospora sp. SA101]|nr:6029_t:CDS:2 [Entrophospora sp. SA101]CAJ0747957.1 24341_t:CDS:2 [Entrophospora sp. SA101]
MQLMLTDSIPPIVWDKCEEFVENFVGCDVDVPSEEFLHDEKNNPWNNLVLACEERELLNESTYVTSMIVLC